MAIKPWGCFPREGHRQFAELSSAGQWAVWSEPWTAVEELQRCLAQPRPAPSFGHQRGICITRKPRNHRIPGWKAPQGSSSPTFLD